MANTVNGIREQISQRIRSTQVRGFEHKPAPKLVQEGFNILNYMQGKVGYFDTIKAVQRTLRDLS
jgi:hypothetical protein